MIINALCNIELTNATLLGSVELEFVELVNSIRLFELENFDLMLEWWLMECINNMFSNSFLYHVREEKIGYAGVGGPLTPLVQCWITLLNKDSPDITWVLGINSNLSIEQGRRRLVATQWCLFHDFLVNTISFLTTDLWNGESLELATIRL